MTDTLKKQIEDMENNTSDDLIENMTDSQEAETDKSDSDAAGDDAQSDDQSEDVNEDQSGEDDSAQDTDTEESGGLTEEEEKAALERKQKQDAYYERKRKDQEDALLYAKAQQQGQVSQQQPTQQQEQSDLEKRLAALEAEKHRDYQIKAAERELQNLEQPFREAFDDYDDLVNDALELSKIRLIEKGVSEADALGYLQQEKVMIANRAVQMGKDPVEAVYNEAKEIISVFDKYAEMRGYVKKTAPKTNLQAVREISKPNAMTGGTGRGAKAAKTEFHDLDDSDLDEIKGVTLAELGL